MAGIILLLGLCMIIALASFLAGAVPLSMTLSPSQLRLLSSIGVGILVGTSLIVIIPEGIEASVAPAEEGHLLKIRSLTQRSIMRYGVNIPPTRRSIPTIKVDREARAEVEPHASLAALLDTKLEAEIHFEKKELGNRFDSEQTDIPESGQLSEQVPEDNHEPEQKPDQKQDQEQEPEHEPEQAHEHEPEHEHSIPTLDVGLSLIFGFVLMFLIDRLPRHATETFHSPPMTQHMSLDNLGGVDSASLEGQADGLLGSLTPTPRKARSLATTIGLVIHAAADGIAMGASASASDIKLGLVIFLAILIHKAPAAFGLTSILLKQGLSKRAARGHLIVFSLAAPIGALTTWFLIKLLGSNHMEGASKQWWTGMLLLFSGGSFLYVAIQAMQEEANGHTHEANHHLGGMNGYGDGGSSSLRKSKGPQLRDTIATMAGMLLPILAQLGHSH